MKHFFVNLACFGILAASHCPQPALIYEKNYRPSFYVVKLKVISKDLQDNNFVYTMDIEDYIKAPSFGTLWGTTVYDAPKKITIPKSCQAVHKVLKEGEVFVAAGEGDKFYVVRKFKNLRENEKKFLKKLKPSITF